MPSKKSRSPNAEKQRVGARPSVRSSALGDGGFVEGPSSVRLILAGVVRSQSLRCQTIYSSCRRLAGPAVGVRALRFLPRSASLTMAVEGAHALVPDGPAQRGRGIHGQYVYWITMSHPRPETVQQLSLRTPALLPAPPSCLTAPELRPTALEAGARAADPPTTPRSPLRRAYLSAPLRPPPYHFTASTRLVDRKVYKNIWNINFWAGACAGACA